MKIEDRQKILKLDTMYKYRLSVNLTELFTHQD